MSKRVQGKENESKVLFEVRKMTQFEITKLLNRMIQKTNELKLIRTSTTFIEKLAGSRKEGTQ